MAKDWKQRLTDANALLGGFDDEGHLKVEDMDLSNLVLVNLQQALEHMNSHHKKKLSQTLHLGKKKTADWRKYTRAILLLEFVLVSPQNRRTAPAIVSACTPKDVAALRADLKGMVKSLDPWLDYGNSDRMQVRPVKMGCSISGGEATGPGSIGCFVRDRNNGKMMILTNQHVALQEFGPDLSRGNPDIRQPAKLNGGSINDRIADYTRGKLDKEMDAAVCQLRPGVAWSNETRPGINQPSIPITGINRNCNVGDYVWKCGCMSFISHGRIENLNKTSGVPHAKFGGTINFEDQIEVKTTTNRQFQIPGDSGSCLINGSNQVIGLLHGGTRGGAVATPIEEVLDYLNVDFVVGSGVAT